MALTLVTLAGIEKNADGSGANGSIDFKLSAPLIDATSGITVNTDTISIPVTNGAYTVTLYANDAAGVLPLGTFYTITKWLIVGQAATKATSYAAVPVALAGAGAGLDDLVYISGVSGDLTSHINDASVHSSGRFVGGAEVANSFSTASTTAVLIPAGAAGVVATRQFRTGFGGFVYNTTVGATTYLSLYQAGVEVDRAGQTQDFNGAIYSTWKERKRVAGSSTFDLRLWTTAGGTAWILPAATYPASLLAIEC